MQSAKHSNPVLVDVGVPINLGHGAVLWRYPERCGRHLGLGQARANKKALGVYSFGGPSPGRDEQPSYAATVQAGLSVISVRDCASRSSVTYVEPTGISKISLLMKKNASPDEVGLANLSLNLRED